MDIGETGTFKVFLDLWEEPILRVIDKTQPNFMPKSVVFEFQNSSTPPYRIAGDLNYFRQRVYLIRDMPYKEKIRNVDDIPETCNEHLGCSQRQVTHQSSPNESVGEVSVNQVEPSVTDHEREPVRDYDSEQHNEGNQLDSEPDSDYYFDDKGLFINYQPFNFYMEQQFAHKY
ncbi:hypothetical protein OUZ56_011023 [Daphnia magna]|uniref:Uncharacterized protein n=1 Tax=Daphnia magna TaxID=35525 RepID=A0ABQ9YZ22_9CRUS|nr:hypothetical protein OUZ56_011023 [Daphnia magna]